MADSKSLKLDSDIKHHAIVGIVLNNILLPLIKTYIDKKLSALYNDLKEKYSVHDEKNSLTNSERKSKGYGFVYTKKEPIKSRHDLAKLYIKQNYMRQFEKIADGKFDASAALTILEAEGKCFSDDLRGLATSLRTEVRNEWAHCNYDNWTVERYNQSFGIFFQLLENMDQDVPGCDVSQAKKDVKHWQEEGAKFLGEHVDPSVVNKVVEAFKIAMESALVERNLLLEAVEDAKKSNVAISDQLAEDKKTFDADFQRLREELDRLKSSGNVEQAVQKQQVELQSHQNVNVLVQVHQPQNPEPLPSQTFTQLPNLPVESIVRVLPERHPFFAEFGREDSLARIKELLLDGNMQPVRIVTVTGLGGIGKTTLVLEACHRLSSTDSFPGGIYWLGIGKDSVSKDEAFEKALVNVLEAVPGYERNKMYSYSELARDVVDYFMKQAATRRILVVIDNLDVEQASSVQHAKKFLSLSEIDNVSLIITSRLERDALLKVICRSTNGTANITLTCLDTDQGIQFLKNRLRNSSYSSSSFDDPTLNSDYEQIVKSVGGLPLALDQAATFIRDTRCTISAYAKSLQEKPVEILEKREAHQVTEFVQADTLSVKTTWNENIKTIEKNAHAGELCHALSFLCSDLEAIPKMLFCQEDLQLDDSELNAALRTEIEVDDIVCVLRRYSLFSAVSNDDRPYTHVKVHLLVRICVRRNLKETRSSAQKNIAKLLEQFIKRLEDSSDDLVLFNKCFQAIKKNIDLESGPRVYRVSFLESCRIF